MPSSISPRWEASERCLTEAGKHLRIEPEDAIACGGSVHAGADGYAVFVIGREVEDGGPALCVQMRVAFGRAPPVLFGVEGAVDGSEPALLPRAHPGSADNQQVLRAGRSDVADADRLGAIFRLFLILVVAQLPRSPRTELLGAKAARGVNVPIAASALGGMGSHVGEDDDGELESLRFVHSHQLHAAGLLLQYGSLGLLAQFVLALQKLDEGAEGPRARRCEAARDIAEAVDVGEPPFAAGVEGKADVGAGRIEQPADGLSGRPVVAAAVEFLKEREDFCDRREVDVEVVWRFEKGCKVPVLLTKLEQVAVGDEEQSAP